MELSMRLIRTSEWGETDIAQIKENLNVLIFLWHVQHWSMNSFLGFGFSSLRCSNQFINLPHLRIADVQHATLIHGKMIRVRSAPLGCSNLFLTHASWIHEMIFRFRSIPHLDVPNSLWHTHNWCLKTFLGLGPPTQDVLISSSHMQLWSMASF